MQNVKTKTFVLRLPQLSDARARLEAWAGQHCAQSAFVTLGGVLHLAAQREAARTAKMWCRLMRAALKRCGVPLPDKRHWLVLVSAEEFDMLLQRCAADVPADAAAPLDEDRVVQLPAKAAQRPKAARRARAAAPAEATQDGSHLITVTGTR